MPAHPVVLTNSLRKSPATHGRSRHLGFPARGSNLGDIPGLKPAFLTVVVRVDFYRKKDTWGNQEMWQKGLEQVYEARGWDPETGIPTRQTLLDNGLDFVVTDFTNRGIPMK